MNLRGFIWWLVRHPKAKVTYTATEVVRYRHILANITAERPKHEEEVVEQPITLLEWPEAGISVPWPKGKTPKEAIVTWAKEQAER